MAMNVWLDIVVFRCLWALCPSLYEVQCSGKGDYHVCLSSSSDDERQKEFAAAVESDPQFDQIEAVLYYRGSTPVNFAFKREPLPANKNVGLNLSPDEVRAEFASMQANLDLAIRLATAHSRRPNFALLGDVLHGYSACGRKLTRKKFQQIWYMVPTLYHVERAEAGLLVRLTSTEQSDRQAEFSAALKQVKAIDKLKSVNFADDLPLPLHELPNNKCMMDLHDRYTKPEKEYEPFVKKEIAPTIEREAQQNGLRVQTLAA